MLIVPGEADCQSAGSFFKNPVLSEAQHLELIKHAKIRGLTVPSYPALETHKKVSAAWLVERSGFVKGHGFGHVGISSKHALAIVNRGGASAAEVIALKEQIQTRVEEIWGVRLEPDDRLRTRMTLELAGIAAAPVGSVDEIAGGIVAGEPTVVLFGASLANDGGFDTVQRITRAFPEVGVVLLVEELTLPLLQQDVAKTIRIEFAREGRDFVM